MKTYFTLLFLFVAVTMNAQKTDFIVGNWVFKEALNEDIDEAGLAYINSEVKDKWQFVFNPDGIFETYMMDEKETGEWKLSADSKNIMIITGIEDGPTKFEILKSTQNELALKLGLGEFLLKRIRN